MATIDGSCHCGAVRWRAPVPTEMTRCNCSYCDRVGARWCYCAPDEFELRSAPEQLSAYEFGRRYGVHYHCSHCGCATHTRFPEFADGKPSFDRVRIGYNIRMAHDFDRATLSLRELDGASF
jgi:hypothetical protein